MANVNDRPERVWDWFVRVGHWVAVAAFCVAYFTQGEPRVVHTYAGYTLAAYVVLRVVWGFIGPEHARFRDFVRSPVVATRYLVDLLRARARRHVGHSPAGGTMVLLLLLSLAATTVAGMTLYALHDRAGPLAGIVISDGEPTTAGETEDEGRLEFWEEAHEVLANVTLLLVILHTAGVIVASRVHRENLVKAMFTGKKRSANAP